MPDYYRVIGQTIKYFENNNYFLFSFYLKLISLLHLFIYLKSILLYTYT